MSPRYDETDGPYTARIPSLFDPPGRVVLGFGDVPPNVVPATVLVDRRLRIAAVFRKRVTQRELAAAGSFFAPCMLPLVPGYLSYVTGLAGTDLNPGVGPASSPVDGRAPATTTPVYGCGVARRRGPVLFVVGFTAVFALLAYAAGAVGRILLVHQRTIEVVAGVLIVALGLAFLDVLPWLGGTWRINRLPRVGVAGAPALGAVFALSWTPCLSPTLSVVMGLAAVQGSAARGTALAVAYSLGMGLPFVGFALGYGRLLRAAGFIRRHNAWVTRLGGAMLVAVGLALVSGAWTEFLNWLRATVGPGQIGI